MKNTFIGHKTKRIYDEFLINHFPNNINTYIEPFGGSFAVSTYMTIKPKKLIYNDIINYNLDIIADEIYHIDYKEIFNKFNSDESFFYIDPPYYNKEYLYNIPRNNKAFHEELQNEISKLKNFILSYEDCEYIRNLYKDFKIEKYSGDFLHLKSEIIIKSTV